MFKVVFFHLAVFCVFFILAPCPSRASVKDHSNRFALWLTVVDPNVSFRVENGDGSFDLTYLPNTPSLSGFGVNLWGLDVEFLSTGVVSPSDEVKKGQTSYEDVRTGIFLGQRKQYYLKAYYNRYKGFYIEDSTDVNPSLTSAEPYIQYSDLEKSSVGTSVTYLFSPEKYSLAAVVNQSAQQTSSGGSWFAQLSFDGSRLHSRDSFIPAVVQDEFGDDGPINTGYFATTTILGGYGYALVWSNVFVSALLGLGTGYQASQYTVGELTSDKTVQVSKLRGLAALGYNGEDFFLVGNYSLEDRQFKTETLKINSGIYQIRLACGLRF